MFLAADDSDGDEAASQFKCRGNRLLKARGDPLLDEQAVHDDFDVVIFALVEARGNVEREEFAVNAHANVAVLRQLFKLFAVRALSSPNYRRQNHDAIVVLAQLAIEDGLHDLLAGLTRDGVAALRAVRDAHGSVDHAEIIVNFGDGADRRTRRARGGLLLDGDGGRKAFDDVDFRTLHLIEELARVGGKRFDVAALPLGIDGVKGQR